MDYLCTILTGKPTPLTQSGVRKSKCAQAIVWLQFTYAKVYPGYSFAAIYVHQTMP